MQNTFQNRILYWLLALIPTMGFYVIPLAYGATWFVLYLLFYLFVYRPLIDTRRLVSLKEIDEKDAWRFFVPLHVDRLQYIRKLWLG